MCSLIEFTGTWPESMISTVTVNGLDGLSRGLSVGRSLPQRRHNEFSFNTKYIYKHIYLLRAQLWDFSTLSFCCWCESGEVCVCVCVWVDVLRADSSDSFFRFVAKKTKKRTSAQISSKLTHAHTYMYRTYMHSYCCCSSCANYMLNIETSVPEG